MISSVRACERCGAVVAILSKEGTIDNGDAHEEWHRALDERVGTPGTSAGHGGTIRG